MLSYMQLPDHGNVHLIKNSAPEDLPLAFVLPALEIKGRSGSSLPYAQ